MIIGLCGKMGSGKDAVAALLTMRGFHRFAFADALRAEVEDAIRTRAYIDHVFSPLALEARFYAGPEEVYQKPTTPRMRALLQEWGTEYRRAQCPDYWVEKVRRQAGRVPYAVISDVRFADEAAICDEVWRIERPGGGDGPGANHVSEAIPFAADRVILNDGSMEQLARRVLAALSDLSSASDTRTDSLRAVLAP